MRLALAMAGALVIVSYAPIMSAEATVPVLSKMYVGPIALRESPDAIRRSLGPGTLSRDCVGNPSEHTCALVLEYTDGSSVVTLTFDKGAQESLLLDSILVRSTQLHTGIARIKSRRRISDWLWEGHRIIEAAPPGIVAGWRKETPSSGSVSFHRNGGFGVTFYVAKGIVTGADFGQE